MTKPITGRLNNGIKYIISDNKCNNTVTIIVFINVGSRNENKGYHGISHYIEHLFFKGTKKYPSPKLITDKLYKYGATINAHTYYDETAYHIKIISDKIDIAMEILSEMLFHSLFNEEDLMMEKKVVINENKRGTSNPSDQLYEELSKLSYKGTSLEHSIGGSTREIDGFTKDMVLSYVNTYYQPHNITISIAGNCKREGKLVKSMNKYFGGKINYGVGRVKANYSLHPHFTDLQKKMRYKNIIRSDLKQTFMGYGFPGYHLDNKDSYPAYIIGTILAGNMSSRLFTKLREHKGLVYNVHQKSEQFKDFGSLKIILSTFNDNRSIEKCHRIIMNEIMDLKKNGVSDEELENAKNFIIGDLLIKGEDSKNIAMFHGRNMSIAQNSVSYAEVINRYKKVKSRDVKRIANKMFDARKLNLVIISTKKV